LSYCDRYSLPPGDPWPTLGPFMITVKPPRRPDYEMSPFRYQP
jgi:hypothetical protein